MKIADYMGALVEHLRERKHRLVKELEIVERHKHPLGEWETTTTVETIDFDSLMDEIDAFNLLLKERQTHEVPNIPEFLDKADAQRHDQQENNQGPGLRSDHECNKTYDQRLRRLSSTAYR